MGVPTSEVAYTPAMPRREDHEVHKGHVVALGEKKSIRQQIKEKIWSKKNNYFELTMISSYNWIKKKKN